MSGPIKLTKIRSISGLALRIDAIVKEHGSYRAAAEYLGVDHAHLWNIRQGKKRPGDKTLMALGLREVTYYEDI